MIVRSVVEDYLFGTVVIRRRTFARARRLIDVAMALNINDPTSVQALLDQLRGSQAWKDITAPIEGDIPDSLGNSDDPQTSPHSTDFNTTSETASTSTSVASLLSQLRSSPSWTAAGGPGSNEISQATNSLSPPTVPAPAPASIVPVVEQEDIRSFTFQQALPRVAQLANDHGFITAIKQVSMSFLKSI